MKLFSNQQNQTTASLNQPSFQHIQQPQQYPTQLRQNIDSMYGRPQNYVTPQRLTYVDTISYRPPAHSFQPNFTPQQQQFAPRPMQSAPTFTSQTIIPQPMQRNVPTTFPAQPMYEYLPKQPAMGLEPFQPFAPVAKKKGLMGIALPQIISLGIGFGLFVIGVSSMLIPVGSSPNI